MKETNDKYLEKNYPLRPAKIIFLNKKGIYFIYENYFKSIMGTFIKGKENDCKEYCSKVEKQINYKKPK